MGSMEEQEEAPRGADPYGTVFPLALLEVARGLHAGDWEVYWALCAMASGGNWVRKTGPQLEKELGLSRTSLYKRLRKLRDKGLIVGTRQGYLLSGRFFFRGRLFNLRGHLDQFDELAHSDQRQPDEGAEGRGDEVPGAREPAGAAELPGP